MHTPRLTLERELQFHLELEGIRHPENCFTSVHFSYGENDTLHSILRLLHYTMNATLYFFLDNVTFCDV